MTIGFKKDSEINIMTITPESVKELLASENTGDRLRAVNQFRDLEPNIAFELVQTAIKDPNTRVRYSATSQMDTLGGQDLQLSLSLLRNLLKDKEPDVQAAAADCIGALKLVEAFDELQQLYHSTPEWIVQLSIIATLGALGEPRGFELLQEALNSDNGLLQITAISAFGELGNPAAVPLLASYVTNPDWQIRHRLIFALEQLGGEEAKAILQNLANDSVDAIASEAKRALS
jgi:HEAT repeat protein